MSTLKRRVGSCGVPATPTDLPATAKIPLMTTREFAPRQNPAKPHFTLDDVRKAIPAHCFERPLYKSFGYLFYDIFMVALMFLGSLFYKQIAIKTALLLSTIFGFATESLTPVIASSALATASNAASLSFALPASGSLVSLVGESTSAFASVFSSFSTSFFSTPALSIYSVTLVSLWVAYIIIQGAIMTGLWVIGHECGHRGFSGNPLISNVVGLTVHSFLLVPYFSWQSSHRKHHSHTGDMELDEVHLPQHINAILPSAALGYLHNEKYDEQVSRQSKGLHPNPSGSIIQNTGTFIREVSNLLTQFNLVFRLVSFVLITTVGWFLYLVMNASGRRYPNNKSILPPNHFVPSSPVFEPSEWPYVLMSNLVLSCYLYTFYEIASNFSFTFLALTYIAPYFVVNYWLVVITLLQHTHTALPHYSTKSWTYLRGALATVDRDFGAFFNFTLHNINDTHVVHHLFSSLPHYHAAEATRAVQNLLKGYYIKTDVEAKPFGVLRSLWRALWECNFVAEDDHPALAEAVSVIESLNKARTGAVAGDMTKEGAKGVTPITTSTSKETMPAVRNPDNEVYWFRTIYS